MAQFTLASPTSTPADSTPPSDSEEEDTLPYPLPLSRTPFLDPAFNPQSYLSTLASRHQTLEDLRSELRQRSQSLAKELLDLVNGEYQHFVELGEELRGGGEKVEGVRVGLLGFEREVEGVRAGVGEVVEQVGQAIGELKEVRKDVAVGRALLEVDDRVSELELALGIVGTSSGKDLEDYDELDDLDDDDLADNVSPGPSSKRLQGRTTQYLLVLRLINRTGPTHPFLVQQQTRLDKIRQTLLLDLSAALRQARSSRSGEKLLEIIKMYGEMGAEKEALAVMKAG